MTTRSEAGMVGHECLDEVMRSGAAQQVEVVKDEDHRLAAIERIQDPAAAPGLPRRSRARPGRGRRGRRAATPARRSDATMPAISLTVSLSPAVIVSHAVRWVARRAHAASSVLLPNPVGAATSVNGRVAASSSRSNRRSRSMCSSRSGGGASFVPRTSR